MIKRISKQAMEYAAEVYGPQRRGELVWDPMTFEKKFAELLITEVHHLIVINGIDDIDEINRRILNEDPNPS